MLKRCGSHLFAQETEHLFYVRRQWQPQNYTPFQAPPGEVCGERALRKGELFKGARAAVQ
jgi:hypothetical protein